MHLFSACVLITHVIFYSVHLSNCNYLHIILHIYKLFAESSGHISYVSSKINITCHCKPKTKILWHITAVRSLVHCRRHDRCKLERYVYVLWTWTSRGSWYTRCCYFKLFIWRCYFIDTLLDVTYTDLILCKFLIKDKINCSVDLDVWEWNTTC